MAHARSITFNRTMAIALAAGVGISGLAIAPSYSGVSLVPSAYAQEDGGENNMEGIGEPALIFRGDATLNPGDVWDSEAPIYEDGIPLPENISFIPSDNNPEWIVVNEDGSVTVTVPEDQGPGEFTYKFDMAVSVVDLAPIITPLGGTITINEIEEPTTTSTTDPSDEPTPTATATTSTSANNDVDKTPTRTISVSVTAKPVDGNNNTGDNNSSSDKGKDAAKYGPKVKTGGTVENVSFLDKIKSFFSV